MVKTGKLYGLMQRIGTSDNTVYVVRLRSPEFLPLANFFYPQNVRRNAYETV